VIYHHVVIIYSDHRLPNISLHCEKISRYHHKLRNVKKTSDASKVPVVNDVCVVVTVVSVLAVSVVNVVGELVLSVTRTHMHLHYSSCCY